MRLVHSALRIAVAVAVLCAVAAQFAEVVHRGLGPANFFSFFTIESNVFAAVVLLFAAPLSSIRIGAKSIAMLRGAATLYMVTTGLVYVLLLSGLEAVLQTTIPWVNLILHYLMPIAMAIDWAIDPAPLGAGYAAIVGRWLAFPLLYVAYSLIRGRLIGWYPYPFLNPNLHGYVSVAAIVAAITVTVAALGVLLVWHAKRRKAGFGRRGEYS